MDPANLVIVVAFVRICKDHFTDRHYVAIGIYSFGFQFAFSFRRYVSCKC